MITECDLWADVEPPDAQWVVEQNYPTQALQPGGDGSDECDAVMAAWWLTLCQVMGENPQTDAEFEALQSVPWAQVACRAQFDLKTYRDRRRDGSIARQVSVKLQYAWINVEDWSLGYTGEVEYG